jgi:hypothetical protein
MIGVPEAPRAAVSIPVLISGVEAESTTKVRITLTPQPAFALRTNGCGWGDSVFMATT